ncbi:DNA polymerase Y family protein [Naasia lichenicola]
MRTTGSAAISIQSSVTRTMVLWCPDWPIIAAARTLEIDPVAPIALIEKGEVFACSAAARADGVRRGLRVREAQSRCSVLEVLPYDQAMDARAFEPIIDAIEQIMPGVQMLRPGTLAIRAQGPSRYFGGEDSAAYQLLFALAEQGLTDARIGIADGPFAAEQAARSTGPSSSLTAGMGAAPESARVRIIPDGGSAAFLSPMPVSLLALPSLAMLLRRLGLSTLGGFAGLPELEVRNRFGEEGAHAHRLAAGLDGSRVTPRIPPDELDVSISFEPPLDRIEQVAFGVREPAERFLDRLAKMSLVCTSIEVEITTERGMMRTRTWMHPRSFTPAEIVDRVRWQLQGTGQSRMARSDAGLDSAISTVRILPESVDAANHHEQGLWGNAPDERIHHGLSRVQSMLGHTAVLTATVGGGRMLIDRQVLVPWGDREQIARPADRPWPGSLPGLPPATVFPNQLACVVLAPDGTSVDIDDRGVLSGPPARFAPPGARSAGPVTAWAGPWPVDERWWDAEEGRELNRFQVVDATGEAWLLLLERGSWWAEGRYD